MAHNQEQSLNNARDHGSPIITNFRQEEDIDHPSLSAPVPATAPSVYATPTSPQEVGFHISTGETITETRTEDMVHSESTHAIGNSASIDEIRSVQSSSTGQVRPDSSSGRLAHRISPQGHDTPTIETNEAGALEEKGKGKERLGLPLKESIGIYGCAGLVGGSVLLLSTVGFLAFLWFGQGPTPEAADASRLWRAIALADWMTRTITICALVLRIVTSVQASICTSMVAALVLENRRAMVRKSQVAHVSVLRSINNGPRKLVQILLGSKNMSVWARLELWLISTLGLLTLVLQFSSTVLLSDLADFVAKGDDAIISVPDYHSSIDNYIGIDVITMGLYGEKPTVYGVFGEYASVSNSSLNRNGFSDTGMVQRGHLPITDKSARTSVRRYRGPTLMSSTRVACVAPRMDAKFIPNDIVYDSVSLTGTLHYGQLLADTFPGTEAESLCFEGNCTSTSFECGVGYKFALEESVKSLCFVGAVGGNYDMNDDLYLDWKHDDLATAVNSSIYLVITSDMTRNDGKNFTETTGMPKSQTHDEWVIMEPVIGRTVNVSLCFARFFVDERYVEMTTKSVLVEPTLTWSPVQDVHNSSLVVNMLNTDNYMEPNKRGLLNMTFLDHPDDWYLANKTNLDTESPVVNAYSPFWVFVRSVNEELNDLFRYNVSITDTLQLTRRPANALHNLYGAVTTSLYDIFLQPLNGTDVAKVAHIVTVRVPGPCKSGSCSGFTIVTTLLGIHLVTVWAITILYVRRVCHSRISNVWHTVSQLYGDELRDVLVQANDATDKLVKKKAFPNDQNALVRLDLAADHSTVEVVSGPP